jgi:phage terminase Nu1 subunit (DNA packaging protein)
MPGKDARSLLKEVITTSDLATLTVQSERSVQRLTKQGIFRLAKDRQGRQLKGRFVVGECVPAFCEHLRELATDDPNEAAYKAARARRMEASAAAAELAVKLQRGQLHRSEDISFFLGNIIIATRDRLRAIPSRLMFSLRGETDPAKINAAISSEIDGALTELSERDLSSMFKRESVTYLANQLGCSEAEVESVMSAKGQEPT